MIRVTVSKDGDPFLQVALYKDDLIIGRGHEADVQLTSEAVSRRHARLQRTESGWQVADLGAANGVYVTTKDNPEPERVVIRPLAAGDRIQIEAFVIELEEVAEGEGDKNVFDRAAATGAPFEETSLETNRTQFISMVDVLAARQAAGQETPPNVTGPIMRFVSVEGSAEGGPVLEHAAPAGAEALPAEPRSAEPQKPRPSVTVSTASSPNAWVARMTSASGHQRSFTLTTAKVTVGTAEACAVRLPSGPAVIVELERAGKEVAFRRVPLWPFPRVIVGGRSEKQGYLSDGESFLVGEFEVTLHLRRDP